MRFTVRVTDTFGTHDLITGIHDSEDAVEIARRINQERLDGVADRRAIVITEEGE